MVGVQDFQKLSLFTQQQMGTQLSYELGKVLRGEEEGWLLHLSYTVPL